jgi:hypothetical protein
VVVEQVQLLLLRSGTWCNFNFFNITSAGGGGGGRIMHPGIGAYWWFRWWSCKWTVSKLLQEQETHLLLVLLKEILVDNGTIQVSNWRWWRWWSYSSW